MNPQRAQKLKDTCDFCSVSKVKCDKQRPFCSRCNKLGYPCIYSPARRKGRPHPPKNQGSQRELVPWRERPSEQQRTAAEGGAILSQTGLPKFLKPKDGARADAIPREQHHREPHDTNYQQDPDSLLHYPQSTLARTSSSDLSSYNDAGAGSSINRTDSADTFYPPTDVTTCNFNTIDAWSPMSGYSDHSINPERSDCATMAMNVLQHLTTTSMEPFHFSSSPHQRDLNNSLDLDTRLTIASTAIKRLSTILICPCSCRTDIGLLNAALCGAILEFYDTILRTFTDLPKPQNASTVAADQMELCVSESSGNNKGNQLQQFTIWRVLEELPKVANLVIQFTRRYISAFNGRAGTAGLGLEEEEEEGAADLLLLALAASQKSRVKSMIHEATIWLAQD